MLNPSQKILLVISSVILTMFFIGLSLECASCTIYEPAEQNHATNYQPEQLNSLLSILVGIERFIVRHEKFFIVLLTFAIAAFTGTLWWVTSGLFSMAKRQANDMRESLDIAKKSADSTALQTRAFVALQIPVVAWVEQKLVNHLAIDVEHERIKNGPLPEESRPVFVFRNVGPTTIGVLYYAIKWEIAPLLRDEPFFGGMSPANLVLEAGQSHAFTTAEPIRISSAQRGNMQVGIENLWVYGFVLYNDFLDESHQMGICVRWDFERGFAVEGSQNYNYHKHQKNHIK